MTGNIHDPETRFRLDMWAVIQAIEDARIVALSGEPIVVPGDRIGTEYYPLEVVLKKMAVDEKLFTFELERKGYYQDINAEYNPGVWVETDEIGSITVKMLEPEFTKMYRALSRQFSPKVSAAIAPAVEQPSKVAVEGRPEEPEDATESEAPEAVAVSDDDNENPIYPFQIGVDRRIYYKKHPLKMSPFVYKICFHLMSHQGVYFSKEQLYEVMYGPDEDIPDGAERVLFSTICKLRDILKARFNKDVIHNDRVLGYRFQIPER